MRQYFEGVARAERRLKVLRAKYDHYCAIGLSSTSQIDSIGGGRQHITSRVEIAAVGMADTMRDLQTEIDKYARIVKEAEELIASIPQERYRDLLTLRYIAGMSWPKISATIGYTDRNSIYRAHGYALREARKVYDTLRLTE